MQDEFALNGDLWKIRKVSPDDPILIDRTGVLTIGVTDPLTMTIYVADGLPAELQHKVLLHEFGHCVIYSYGLTDTIHRLVKSGHWIEAEERLCNFIVNYSIGVLGIRI